MSVSDEGPRLTVSSVFRAQLTDTMTPPYKQLFSLTFVKKYSFNSEKAGLCHTHIGKVSHRLLAPAKHNCPELSGTLYCRENIQYLSYC